MASPSAEVPPKDEGGEYCNGEEDESGVEVSVVQCEHRLGGFDGGECLSGDEPLNYVDDYEDMYENQGQGSPFGHS